MKQFLKNITRFSIICLIPALLLLLAGYVYFDPFKVLYKYKSNETTTAEHDIFPFNRDFTGTEFLIRHYQQYKYNSFIFGSSRARIYRTQEWKKYLQPDDVAFSFNGAGESVYGIYKKMCYLDAKNIKIKNALIVICRDWTFAHDDNQNALILVKHPEISGESKLFFHWLNLKYYFNKYYLKPFYTYQLTHQYQPWMSDVVSPMPIEFNHVYNESILTGLDSLLTENAAKYYNDRKDVFYKRTGEKTDSVERINAKQVFMLNEIKRILIKNNTNYRVICSPLYEQIKFHPNDMKKLTAIFGVHLFDFSGKNGFTDSITNYYENSHCRPMVGDSILKIIYK